MKVSIIIPVYNKIRYIATILQQVKDQSFADFECLIIDDGSSDGSGAVCDTFAAEDQRFRVFHIPNGGVSHARNVGLDAAQGEYITFIDADDGIKLDYLENLIRCAEESGVDLVISGYQKVDANGRVLRSITPETTGVYPFSELFSDFAQVQMQSGLHGCCVAKVFRRNLVKGIRFDESLKLAEDFDFYLNLYEIVETIYFDNHTSYLYLHRKCCQRKDRLFSAAADQSALSDCSSKKKCIHRSESENCGSAVGRLCIFCAFPFPTAPVSGAFPDPVSDGK